MRTMHDIRRDYGANDHADPWPLWLTVFALAQQFYRHGPGQKWSLDFIATAIDYAWQRMPDRRAWFHGLRRDALALVADTDELVHSDSDHDAHRDLFQTLDLLMIPAIRGPVYFIVEGCHPMTDREVPPDQRYFYEEHTCPTNFIGIPMVATYGNRDPHGVFTWLRSVWMPQTWIEVKDSADAMAADDYLSKLFPEIGLVTED